MPRHPNTSVPRYILAQVSSLQPGHALFISDASDQARRAVQTYARRNGMKVLTRTVDFGGQQRLRVTCRRAAAPTLDTVASAPPPFDEASIPVEQQLSLSAVEATDRAPVPAATVANPFPIATDIPPPFREKRTGRSYTYPHAILEVGQSFLLPPTAKHVKGKIRAWGRDHKRTFCTQIRRPDIHNETGIRVWRVA